MAENLKALLEQKLLNVLKFKSSELISRPSWGEISFKEAQSSVEIVLDLASSLKALPLEKISPNKARKLSAAFQDAIQVLTEIDSYSISSDSHIHERNNLITRINESAEVLSNQAGPIIGFLAYIRGDFDKNIQQISEQLSIAKDTVETAKEEISNKKKQIDDTLSAAREVSANAGAAVFTTAFKDHAVTLSNKSRVWLIITSFLALYSIEASVILTFGIEPLETESSAIAIQHLFGKFSILAVLFASTIWCGRIYKALVHQSTVYDHKALSIQTLQAFQHSAADAAAKDTVVVEAARAVFSNTPTGFINSGDANAEGSSQIIEIIKQLNVNK